RHRLPPPRTVRTHNDVSRQAPSAVAKSFYLILAAVVAGIPWLAGEYYINLTSQIFIAAIFAASLNLLVGYGGLPSLGHASWLGLAAYISAWMSLKLGLAHWATAPAALLGTTLIACAFGWISRRALGA